MVLGVQTLVTDNRRLLEAKQRAAVLNNLARVLPGDSPRRAALLRLTTAMPLRTLLAALVPIGFLIGPMVMSFVWLRQRIDPSVWSPPPGSAVQVVALVNGDWGAPVRIDVPRPVMVDDSTPSSRTLPPLRPTLERLLVLLRQPRDIPGEPWELKVVPDLGREQTANDLQAYLARGIPPQGITWLVRPPEDWSGHFPVTVSTPGHSPLTVSVVLGEVDPPVSQSVRGHPGSPLEEIKVVCPGPKGESPFWQLFGGMGLENHGPFFAWLATINLGWLEIYLMVYLAALILKKAGSAFFVPYGRGEALYRGHATFPWILRPILGLTIDHQVALNHHPGSRQGRPEFVFHHEPALLLTHYRKADVHVHRQVLQLEIPWAEKPLDQLDHVLTLGRVGHPEGGGVGPNEIAREELLIPRQADLAQHPRVGGHGHRRGQEAGRWSGKGQRVAHHSN